MNGATQTFRRPSVATNPSHNRDSSQTTSVSTSTVGAYIPPHMTSNQQPSGLRNGLATGENRYSKDQLLDLYKSQRETGALGKNMADYFVADWDPHVETAVNGAWGKRDDQKDSATGPEVCWDHGGHVEPLALMDMSDEEKEVCVSMFCGTVLPRGCMLNFLVILRVGQLSFETPAVECHQRQQPGCWYGSTQIIRLLSPE